MVIATPAGGAKSSGRRVQFDPRSELRGHRHIVTGVAITADGRWGFSASWDHTLRFWDIETGECRWVIDKPEVRSGETCIAISPNGQYVVATLGPTLRVWDVRTRECVALFASSEAFSAVSIGSSELIVVGTTYGSVYSFAWSHQSEWHDLPELR